MIDFRKNIGDIKSIYSNIFHSRKRLNCTIFLISIPCLYREYITANDITANALPRSLYREVFTATNLPRTTLPRNLYSECHYREDIIAIINTAKTLRKFTTHLPDNSIAQQIICLTVHFPDK
jgi:hypothetical protein